MTNRKKHEVSSFFFKESRTQHRINTSHHTIDLEYYSAALIQSRAKLAQCKAQNSEALNNLREKKGLCQKQVDRIVRRREIIEKELKKNRPDTNRIQRLEADIQQIKNKHGDPEELLQRCVESEASLKKEFGEAEKALETTIRLQEERIREWEDYLSQESESIEMMTFTKSPPSSF